jgi:hypothetical protein
MLILSAGDDVGSLGDTLHPNTAFAATTVLQ